MRIPFALILLSVASTFPSHADEIDWNQAILLEPIADSAPRGTSEPAIPPCVQRGDCYLFDSSWGEPIYRMVNSNETIRLLGKGVQGKKSQQNLTLACVGQDHSCDQLQFVYYVNPQELYSVGPKFRVGSAAHLKRALKTLSKESLGRSQAVGTLTLLGGGVVSFALIPLVGPTSFLIFFTAGVVSVFLLGNNHAGEPFDVVRHFKDMTYKDDGLQLMNQNGWNWSSGARPISEKKFGAMIRYLQALNGFFASNQNVQVIQ